MQDRMVSVSNLKDSLDELANEIALTDSLCNILITLIEDSLEIDEVKIGDFACILKRHANAVRNKMRDLYDNL